MKSSVLFSVGVLCLASAATVAAATPSPVTVKQLANWQKLPLRFEENRGQSASSIRFTAHTGQYQVSLTSQAGALLQSPGVKPVRMSFAGSSRTAASTGVEPCKTPVQFFKGQDKQHWLTDVPQYSRVRYTNVYPGTDVVFYGQDRQLEYDFVLQPGADPRRIRLQFDGADRLAVTSAGDVEIQTGSRTLVHKKPVIYQTDAATGERQLIAGSYRQVDARTVQFQVAAYDKHRSLVIDPVLNYSSYIGGGATDAVLAMALDPSGFVYLAGYTDSTDITTTTNSFASASTGSRDMFLAKLDPSQSGGNALLYFSYFGGTSNEEPRDMAIDQNGIVYLTGFTTSTDFPRSGYFLSNGLAGAQDAFAMKIDTSLTGTDVLAYSTFLGGSARETGYGVAVDTAGVIYVTGNTFSDDFPIVGNSYQSGRANTSEEAFVAKLDPSQTSSLVYSTFYGGGGPEEGRSIVVEPNGLIDIAGTTGSVDLPITADRAQQNYTGGLDAFVARFDPTKSGSAGLVYSTFLGGGDHDEARKIRRTADGKLLVTGFTISSDFPVVNAAQPNQLGNGDAFVTRLNPAVPGAAGLEYSTYLGGSDAEVGYDVAPAADGSFWVVGYTMSMTNFPIQNALSNLSSYQGAIDGFLTHINTAGRIDFSTYLGGSSVDVATSVAVNAAGSVFVSGYTTSGFSSNGTYTGIPFPTTNNSLQTGNNGGGSDGFLVVVTPQ